ncbi:hypothetical protein D3C80_1545930 [compost metagenome]
MATQKRMSALGMPWTRQIPAAAPHSKSMMNSSSRASDKATSKPWLSAFFGVRKNGMLVVKKPYSTALAIVCDKARPARAAKKASLRLTPTARRYRKMILPTLNTNSANGGIAKISNGGSTRWGTMIMAADHSSAPKVKKMFMPSATQGSQPARKW